MKIDNFFAELKRRNVYKVAVAYVVAGWALSQGIAQVFPVFDVPNWTIRLIVLLIIIGLPIALVLAWMFELTPQGIKRTEDCRRDAGDRAKEETRLDLCRCYRRDSLDRFFFLGRYSALDTASPARTSNKSIAILPFSDLSPNHDQESFSDGMAEEILNALAHIKDLKVVGRASSFFYKGKNVSLKQIGSELGVANILEGSIRKQGEQVRITSALSHTADGLQVWSKIYNGTLANIFDLQESFARDIAGELNVVLADPSEGRVVDKPTDNAQAYALFIEAQTLVSQRVGDSLPRAIALLKEATRLDPNFARAWGKLAVALAVEPQYAAADWQTNWAAAEPAAQRAIALDPKSAEAYAALGYIDFSRRRYVEMVEPAQRAVAIDPNDVTANFWLANQLAATGRIAEAETVNDRALKADPANALVIFYKALMRWRQGRQRHGSQTRETSGGARRSPWRSDAWIFGRGGGRSRSGAEAFSRGFRCVQEWVHQGGVSRDLSRQLRRRGETNSRRFAVIAARPHDQFAGTLLLLLGEPEQSFASFERDGIGLSDGYYTFLWQPDAWSRKARQHPAFQGFRKTHRLG